MESVVAEHVSSRAGVRLIDLGCGNMPYRALFAPHVTDYLGCDLRGNELADLFFDTEGRAPVADGSADVVLSSQVLEHVPDPTLYLREARRILRSGGLLVLSTHGVWRYHPDPTDYWRWTRDGLLKLIGDQGFEVCGVRGVLGPAASGLQHWQDAVIGGLARPLRRPFALVLQCCIQLADRRSTDAARERDAGTYVVVARKLAEATRESSGA